MRVHYLQHVPFEGLGSIAPWLNARGATVRATKLYDGDALPSPDDFDWLIVMGGPMSIHDEHLHPSLAAEKRCIAEAIAASKCVLGICLGAQLIASALGQRVYSNAEPEIGWFPIHPAVPRASGPLAAAFSQPLEVFHWHGETFDLPPGAAHIAASDACRNQAFSLDDRVLALQFHLEMTTESAKSLAEACGNELVDAPFVQSADEMLGDARRFDDTQATLAAVLESLAMRCEA